MPNNAEQKRVEEHKGVKAEGPVRVCIVCVEPGDEGLFENVLDERFEVKRCTTSHSLRQSINNSVPDVVVMDAETALGKEQMLRTLGREYARLPVVVIAPEPAVETVVRCMKEGAHDVVSAKHVGRELASKLQAAARQHRLLVEVDQLADAYKRRGKFGGLVGISAPLQTIYTIVRNVADTDASVLLSGESGTGKELVARAIHELSRRRGAEFVCVNCAAIPKDLLESELFGHEKGAFTSADSRRIGCCERADKGTLFLDEVCEMDVGLQSKLLRFLQDRTFTRVGGMETLEVDTRVIAATNREPLEELRIGKLRDDLYYRLNVVPIVVPALRERPEDIPVLAQHFLELMGEKYNKYFVDFSAEALRALLCYKWPGNVRELQNTIERIVVLASSDRITLDQFPEQIRAAAEHAEEPPLSVDEALRYVGQALREPVRAECETEDVLPFEEVEKRAILEAIRKCDGDISKASRKLELSRATIYRKLDKYGLR